MEISFCLFHLCNNAVKNAFERGLKPSYNGELRIWLRCLPALAFLPLDEVLAGFEDVKHKLLNDPESPVHPDDRQRVESNSIRLCGDQVDLFSLRHIFAVCFCRLSYVFQDNVRRETECTERPKSAFVSA